MHGSCPSIFCMLPTNGNCIKVCCPSFCLCLFQFTLSSSVSIPLTRYQCTKLERSSSSEDSPNPSTPHCTLPLSKAKSLERSLAEANLWSLFVRRKSWDVMGILHPITWPDTIMFHCFTTPSSKLPSGTFDLHISTLFSALVTTLQQSSIIMELPWNKTWGFPCCRSWFSGRWQRYHQCSPCNMELSKRPPRSFFLGDESVQCWN